MISLSHNVLIQSKVQCNYTKSLFCEIYTENYLHHLALFLIKGHAHMHGLTRVLGDAHVHSECISLCVPYVVSYAQELLCAYKCALDTEDRETCIGSRVVEARATWQHAWLVQLVTPLITYLQALPLQKTIEYLLCPSKQWAVWIGSRPEIQVY